VNFHILYFDKCLFYTLCSVLQLELCSWYYFSQWLSALRPRYHPAHSGLSAKVLGKKLTRCDGDCCLFKCIPLHIHTHAHLGGSWSPPPQPTLPRCFHELFSLHCARVKVAWKFNFKIFSTRCQSVSTSSPSLAQQTVDFERAKMANALFGK